MTITCIKKDEPTILRQSTRLSSKFEVLSIVREILRIVFSESLSPILRSAIVNIKEFIKNISYSMNVLALFHNHTPFMKAKYLILSLFAIFSFNLAAQPSYELLDSLRIDGKVFSAIIQNGDTLILAQLDDVNFTSPRSFSSRDEYRRYLKYKKYAAIVYPYAKDAINILKKVDERTEHMRKRKKKKYVKNTYKQLELNFKNQLKGLTKTQGTILIKMIEKEMDESFYNIIKDKRNGFTAMYWHQFGKMFDYNLKRGYVRGDDLILDAVLDGFDISYKEDSGGIILSN